MLEHIENINKLAEQLAFSSYDGFPDIELYMDQVIDFLTRSKTSLRDDKLSSAMVNNYIKADILPRARGKKYSREHLVQLAVIIRLKQVLSVKDTGALIKAAKADNSDEKFFNDFREIVGASYGEIISRMKQSDDTAAEFAMNLAVRSYVYKVACEYFIDNLLYAQPTEKAENPHSKTGDK